MALMGAGLAGMVGLAATSNLAGADTPSFNVTCTIAGMTTYRPDDGDRVDLVALRRAAPVSVNGLSLNSTFS